LVGLEIFLLFLSGKARQLFSLYHRQLASCNYLPP
jgi:hypothetical protein